MGVCGISHRFQWLSPTPGQIPTRYSPVRRCPPPEGGFSLDLHVLGLPPAFVLSQDQTLTLLTPARLKQTDKHKSRPSILKHLQNTRNNFNAPNRHTTPTAHPFRHQTIHFVKELPPKRQGRREQTARRRPKTSVLWAGLIRPALSGVNQLLQVFFMFSKKVRKGRKYHRLTCTGHINMMRSARRW